MTQPPAESLPPQGFPPPPPPPGVPSQPVVYPPPDAPSPPAAAYPPPHQGAAYPPSPPAAAYPPPPALSPFPTPMAPPPAGTNGFAIASLIFGIIGGVVLSVIFGIIALVQIPRRHQRGKGLAVAGLILSGLWIIGVVVVIAIALGTSATRDTSGGIVDGGSLSVTDLAAGDCFNGLTEDGVVFTVDAVPCGEPHDAEVFAVFDLPGADYPGEDVTFDQAQQGCNERLEDYSQAAVTDDSIELYVFHPTSQSWRQGDHEVTCIAGTPSGKRTGTIRD